MPIQRLILDPPARTVADLLNRLSEIAPDNPHVLLGGAPTLMFISQEATCPEHGNMGTDRDGYVCEQCDLRVTSFDVATSVFAPEHLAAIAALPTASFDFGALIPVPPEPTPDAECLTPAI